MLRSNFPTLSWRSFAAALFIATGWSWYHFSMRDAWIFFAKLSLILVVSLGAFLIAKYLYVHAVTRTRRSSFWTGEMLRSLDTLFFASSLLFGIFFFKNELASLLYSALVFWFIFWQIQIIFSRHPSAVQVMQLSRVVFAFAFVLFVTQSALQYTAYHYYILDSNIKFFNIVFFRSFAVTLVWLALFALASLLFVSVRSRVVRSLGFIAWGITYVFFLGVWAVNIAILYFSGLYISPVALGHAAGSESVMENPLSLLLIGLTVGVTVLMALLIRRVIAVHQAVPRKWWYAYDLVLLLVAFLGLTGLSSLRNTPERAVLNSFYDFYIRRTPAVELSPALRIKLQKFGLNYDPTAFRVLDREVVFSPTTTVFLPQKLVARVPNVLIVYVESFSARFSGVYNEKLRGVTPHFDAFLEDKDTTIFTNYFNASTPTITGTLSQLCSFLPPTGHNEIQNERKLQNHHLLCLPEILKKFRGFKTADYLTAVDKEFAHKNGIFTSMGVDKVLGTSELADYISGEPLSWGYSDHQLFPALFDAMKRAPEPFLMMLATVDTHPPFNLAKDAVPYGDGNQPVLNMFHTTDHAFGLFWEQFKASSFATNTIVVVVGDHAIFPGAITTDIFPDEAGKMTYYDRNFFGLYVPGTVLPKQIDTLSSGLDQLPTLLQLFNIQVPNSFEGYSMFGDRAKYPNILGMHELGLYVNQVTKTGGRQVLYNTPSEISCPNDYSTSSTLDFTLCDYLNFYHWKRAMFEQGRFWKK